MSIGTKMDAMYTYARTHVTNHLHLPAGGAIEAAESDLNNGDVGI
jgi:hypothetical protein